LGVNKKIAGHNDRRMIISPNQKSMHQGKGIGAKLSFKITAFQNQFKIKKSMITKILADFTHSFTHQSNYFISFQNYFLSIP
jgi:hypothetical protein